MPEPKVSLERFIARLPKVELHLHLEGSVRPETLRELARARPSLKKKVAAWIGGRKRQSYRYGSFRKFLVSFGLVSLLLETPEDYALVTTRLLEWLAGQNVKYAEITLSAGVVLWKKQSFEAVFEAVAAAATEAEARTGVRVQWILDAVRQFGLDPARQVLDFAARYGSRGVVAFGIGGDEERGPAELFADLYRRARDRGLHTTAHAGEGSGPESVRQAVELLGAERIGHGLNAARDAEVMALLRDRAVPLEVCITSNVATGVLRRLEDHPLPRFLRAGVIVTLNSDDPAMFGTSLENEFAVAAKTFSLSRRQLIGFCENAIRVSFLPEQERQRLLSDLQTAVGTPRREGKPPG